MRPFEALLMTLTAISAVLLFVSVRHRCPWSDWLPFAGIVVFALHWLFEGSRWQMFPVYGTVVILVCSMALIFGGARSDGRERNSKWAGRTRMMIAVTGLTGVVGAAALTILFPHLQLPMPSGPYPVGTTNLYFVDRHRPEPFTSNPQDHRELFARVWYPSELASGQEPVSYCENAHEISRALTAHTVLPFFLFDHLALVSTHSFRDVNVAEEDRRFPIVIFSHAYWGGVSQCTVLLEELASHGYVSVSIGHPYETPYRIEPDERVTAFDPRNPEFCLRSKERLAAFSVQQQLNRTRNPEALDALLREISRLRPKTIESLHIWSEDISSTIDELARIDRGDGLLAGKLDFERVAVVGHSFGGAAAGQACLDDARCKAGINMDGLQLGDMLDEALSCPFLFMHHDNSGARNRAPNRLFFERAKGPTYLMVIEGTGHLSFSDLSLYGSGSFFRMTSPLGRLDGRYGYRIVCDAVRAFLDTHLREDPSAPFGGLASRYPEVELLVRSPARQN